MSNQRLLSNITILSLEQATTLPFLTQRLARDGAHVIRIEAPGRGDPNRHVGRNILNEDGMASYFLPNNSGKQAITLNLSEQEGRSILHRLIDRLHVEGTRAYASEMARHGWRTRDAADVTVRRYWTLALGIALEGHATGRSATAMANTMREAMGEVAETGSARGVAAPPLQLVSTSGQPSAKWT